MMQCAECDTTNPDDRERCIRCGASLPVEQRANSSLITDTTPQQRTPFYARLGRWQHKGVFALGIAVLCVLFVVVGVWPMMAALFGVILARQFWDDDMMPQAAASVLFFVGLGVLLYLRMVWPAVLPLLVVAGLVSQWRRLRGLARRAS